MRTTSTAALVFTLGVAASASAAPSISTAPATLSHGRSLTIVGAGFGTKPQAAPYKYDDFSSGLAGNPLSGWYTTNSPRYSTNRLRHAFSTMSARQNFESSYSQYIGQDDLPTGTKVLYVSGWFNFQSVAGTAASRNTKIMSMGTDLDGADGWQTRVDTYPTNGTGHLYAMTGAADCTASATYVHDYSANVAEVVKDDGLWHRIESYLRIGADGYRDVFMDGAKIAEISGSFTGAGCNLDYVILGHYFANDTGSPTPQANRYWSEIYVDTTPQRVELCTGGTWSARGACELQLPSTWEDTSISATANAGSLSGTAFLYVVDAANAANPSGHAMTIDAVPAAITCHEDADGDRHGHGVSESGASCRAGFYVASHFVSLTGDCDDTPGSGASINAGAAETCGDGIDQDCSGADSSCAQGDGCCPTGCFPVNDPDCGGGSADAGGPDADENRLDADRTSARPDAADFGDASPTTADAAQAHPHDASGADAAPGAALDADGAAGGATSPPGVTNGCGCSSSRAGSPWWTALVVLGLVAPLRSRR